MQREKMTIKIQDFLYKGHSNQYGPHNKKKVGTEQNLIKSQMFGK